MRGKRLRVNIPHVVADTDRHGNVRIYYRRKGKAKVRLFETPGTPEFSRELEAAKEQADAEPPRGAAGIAPGSLRRLCQDYYRSTAFALLDPETRRVRANLLDAICRTKTPAGVERASLPFSRMEPRHVEDIRNEKLEFPASANGRVKALRQLFKWAIKVRLLKANPAVAVDLLSNQTDGHHTWTAEELAQFEAHHPLGTQARLAFALLLFTGVRRSDVVKLGPFMERDGALHFAETKGARSKVKPRKGGPKARVLPILPELRAVIDASAKITGPFAYLLTDQGAPFTGGGFGNKFRDWCVAASLPTRCSPHGLRKAGATIAAENGATEHQLMAIFGWDSPSQAALYTRKANRTKMAAEAMHLMSRRNEPGVVVSHPKLSAGVPPKKA